MPHTIRLHTTRPHPLLPLDLASVSIIARHAAEGAQTEDYNSGKAAIGTGPYRLVGLSLRRPGRAGAERRLVGRRRALGAGQLPLPAE